MKHKYSGVKSGYCLTYLEYCNMYRYVFINTSSKTNFANKLGRDSDKIYILKRVRKDFTLY